MRYIVLLALLFNCVASTSEIKQVGSEKVNKTERNIAVWGTDEFSDTKNNFPSEAYHKNQIPKFFFFFNIPSQKVSMIILDETGNSFIRFNDKDRSNFQPCLSKFIEWANIATSKDNITKKICTEEFETISNVDPKDIRNLNNKDELPRSIHNFDFTSSFGESEFIITIHHNEKTKKYFLNKNVVTFLQKSLSDETIKLKVSEFTKTENRLNNKFK